MMRVQNVDWMYLSYDGFPHEYPPYVLVVFQLFSCLIFINCVFTRAIYEAVRSVFCVPRYFIGSRFMSLCLISLFL